MAGKKKKYPLHPINRADIRILNLNPRVVKRLLNCDLQTVAAARRAGPAGIQNILRHAEFDPNVIEDTIRRIFYTDYPDAIPEGTPSLPSQPTASAEDAS